MTCVNRISNYLSYLLMLRNYSTGEPYLKFCYSVANLDCMKSIGTNFVPYMDGGVKVNKRDKRDLKLDIISCGGDLKGSSSLNS